MVWALIMKISGKTDPCFLSFDDIPSPNSWKKVIVLKIRLSLLYDEVLFLKNEVIERLKAVKFIFIGILPPIIITNYDSNNCLPNVWKQFEFLTLLSYVIIRIGFRLLDWWTLRTLKTFFSSISSSLSHFDEEN